MFHPQGPGFWELVRQALSSTQVGYDLLAEKFEFTPFRTPDEVIGPTLAAGLENRSVGDVLDICCGTGAALRMVAPHQPTSMEGLDFSAGMLSQAQAILEKEAPEIPLRLVQGDALAMSYDSRFDLALCFGAFGHIRPHQEAAFCRAIFRALKPGGCFVFVTSYHPRFWSLGHLVSRAFNGVMHLRNILIKPKFIMFYLTFLLPEVRALLMETGFEVEVLPGSFQTPFQGLRVVRATKPKLV